MLSALKHAFADLARPAAIYMLAAGCLYLLAWAPFVDDANSLVGMLVAGGGALATLVGAKAYENATTTKAQGEVDKLKAAASGGTQP